MSRTTSTRTSTYIAIAILTALVTFLAATGTAQAAGWQYAQTDGDGYWDAASIDRNGNGLIDDARFDFDNDGRWDSRVHNTRFGDELLETANYDMDENGVAEYLILDTDQRAGFEYVYVNRNQDAYWDFRRIIPGSSADYVNRINTNNANNRILHQFSMRTGQSLLYPSFSMP